MAFAPSCPLLGVPSSSTIAWSMARWSVASTSSSAGPIVVLTWFTACSTPLPPQRAALPSRNSTASKAPVEAPDGTAARPVAPDSRMTSTSTVGLPRESRIWRPCMDRMALMAWG